MLKIFNLVPAVLTAVFALSMPALLQAGAPRECSYEMRIWNVNRKTSGLKMQVRHLHGELKQEEIDPVSGCTVCKEDQEIINLPPILPFEVCYKFAPKIRSVLEHLLRNGEPIRTVRAYRVIKSRGTVDADGNRTEFSNHSFGTAIDINPEQNGLYDNCITFGPECRLILGGEWLPGIPGTLEKNGEIADRFRQAGFKWGGEIEGRQKDFMHFSLTGH